MTSLPEPPSTVIDVYFDPVCPYAWLTSRWLTEVAEHRRLQLRHHVMSLKILNENSGQGGAYLANVLRTVGPSRVFTAAAVHLGEAILPELYAAFGTVWFDRWRHPEPAHLNAALHTALAAVGLPAFFVELADSDAYDSALRDSHLHGIADLGPHAGTPILHINTIPWFGPVLNTSPRGQHALDLYDSIMILAEHNDFVELKRARTKPPQLE